MKEIVQSGAPVLREIAKDVPEELFGTDELAQIIKSMEDSLDPFEEGVALAAPQIGISYRIFVVPYRRLQEMNRFPQKTLFSSIRKSSKPLDDATAWMRGAFQFTECMARPNAMTAQRSEPVILTAQPLSAAAAVSWLKFTNTRSTT